MIRAIALVGQFGCAIIPLLTVQTGFADNAKAEEWIRSDPRAFVKPAERQDPVLNTLYGLLKNGFTHPGLADELRREDRAHFSDARLSQLVSGAISRGAKHDFLPSFLTSGLSLELSAQQLLNFSGSDSSSSPRDPVRYGLKAKSIEPAEEKYNLATLESDPYLAYGSMPRAKIEWEVVPIEDERLDKVAPKSDQKTTSFLSALTLRGKILLDQNAGKTPKPRLILEQPHGYYRVELGGTDKREDFRVPLLATLDYNMIRLNDKLNENRLSYGFQSLKGLWGFYGQRAGGHESFGMELRGTPIFSALVAELANRQINNYMLRIEGGF
jgi:hypothetical protein